MKECLSALCHAQPYQSFITGCRNIQVDMPEDTEGGSNVTRRRALQVLGTASSAGLAGCNILGGGDTGDENHGERVPEITLEYWSDLGGTTKIAEDVTPIIKDNMNNALGVPVNLKPTELTTSLNGLYNDSRQTNMVFWYSVSSTDLLDPHQMTRRFAVDWAGNNNKANPPNYANCEHTHPAIGQSKASSQERRRELVNEAQSIMSNDAMSIELVPYIEYGATRSDKVDAQRVGNLGVSELNTRFLIATNPKEGDRLIVATNPQTVETTNYFTMTSFPALAVWSHLINTTLVEFDENLDMQNMLAKTIETTREGRRVTVEIQDATFHNGDPITAEDMKFTFEFIANNPFPHPSDPGYNSVETVDDKTVEFNLEEPFPPLIPRDFQMFGITHKKSWVEQGGTENSQSFQMDPIVGSGPYKVDSFQSGQSLNLEPHDGHPVYSPSKKISFQVFRDAQSAFTAFQDGEVHVAPGISPGNAHKVEEEMSDVATVETLDGWTPFTLFPQHSFGPQQFKEFRDAMGKSLDRRKINQVGFYGDSEPELYSTPLVKNHPFRPPDDQLHKFTDNEEGDPEAAKQALRDAGWSWDSNGRLRYPEDTDPSPRWPKDSTPQPDDFPCIDSDGNYVSESQ